MYEKLLDFKSLQVLVEQEQDIITVIKASENNISIVLLKDIVIGNNFFQITFRIDEKMLILSWLYLLYESKGTGARVINWFIDYCVKNNIKVFRIANVEDNKIKMRALCYKFGFIEHRRNENYSDYYLKIR